MLLNSVYSMILWSNKQKTLGAGESEWRNGVHMCVCISFNEYKERSRERTQTKLSTLVT